MSDLDWRTVSLGEVLTQVKRPLELQPETSYRTLGVRLYGNGPFAKDEKMGSQIAAKSLNHVVAGDIVYSKLFAWRGALGCIPESLNGVLASTEFPTFVATDGDLLGEFFALWASRPAVWSEAELASTGTTAASRNRLSVDDFLELEIELPPVEVQESIIAIAALVDRVAAARMREFEATQSVVRAAREHLLATEDGWEDLPEGWTSTTLGEVADIRSGITKGRKTRDALRPVPFLRAANVQDGFLELQEVVTLDVTEGEVERFALQHGDLLLVEGSGSQHRLGTGWLWGGEIPGPVVCQNHVFRVRPDPEYLAPRFLAHVALASPARAHFWDAAKSTSGLFTINKTQVGELVVPLPPLAVQEDIVRQLDALRTSAHRTQRLIDANAVLRASLIEDLVTGVREPPTLD